MTPLAKQNYYLCDWPSRMTGHNIRSLLTIFNVLLLRQRDSLPLSRIWTRSERNFLGIPGPPGPDSCLPS